eukprot:augustus_masked-scaffold_3-processed-gene-16.10-mRNA-1 protein AED:0.28 eAED:0.28 QI:0/-1/0/1/-1/1/1/0/530
MGFKAAIILWDYEKKELLQRLPQMHKVKVQAVSFSYDNLFLCSLGGSDCNLIAVTNIKKNKVLAFNKAANDFVKLVICMCKRYQIISCGETHVKMWTFHPEKTVLQAQGFNLGPIKRVFTSIAFIPEKQLLFVGSTSGDIFGLTTRGSLSLVQTCSELIAGGINYLKSFGSILVAASGGGEVVTLSDKLVVLRRIKFSHPVTSLALKDLDDGFIGTKESNIFTFKNDIVCSSHVAEDISFLDGFAGVFVTARRDVRIWTSEGKELLRIKLCTNLPGTKCTCVKVSGNGSVLLTGWSDGKIRAFKPKSGKLLFVIDDTHRNGVTALNSLFFEDEENNRNRGNAEESTMIVSGGNEGEVRLWGIIDRKMHASLKDHKARVNSIEILQNTARCLTSSEDGSCVVWDLRRRLRIFAFFANTMFKGCCFSAEGAQLISVGSDKMLRYHDAVGNVIREVECSNEIDSVCLSPDGTRIITGERSGTVKVWDYNTAQVLSTGKGHSRKVNKVLFSPDGSYIVSVGEEGGVFLWNYHNS